MQIGYLILVTLIDITTGNQIENALQEMSRTKPLDGLIFNNRQNEGGADTVLIEALYYFTNGMLGFLMSRHEER
jgi:C-terminal processing protease CtpA/Prc